MSKRPIQVLCMDVTDIPYFLANVVDLALTVVTIVLLSIALSAFEEKADVSGVDFDGRIDYFITRAIVISGVASVSYYLYFLVADHGKKSYGKFVDSVLDAANRSSYVLMGSSLVMAKSASWMSDLYSKDSTKDVRDRLNEAFYVQIALMGLRVLNLARHKIYIEPAEKEEDQKREEGQPLI